MNAKRTIGWETRMGMIEKVKLLAYDRDLTISILILVIFTSAISERIAYNLYLFLLPICFTVIFIIMIDALCRFDKEKCTAAKRKKFLNNISVAFVILSATTFSLWGTFLNGTIFVVDLPRSVVEYVVFFKSFALVPLVFLPLFIASQLNPRDQLTFWKRYTKAPKFLLTVSIMLILTALINPDAFFVEVISFWVIGFEVYIIHRISKHDKARHYQVISQDEERKVYADAIVLGLLYLTFHFSLLIISVIVFS